MAQKHLAKLRITCDLEIPQYQKGKGIEIDLESDQVLAGQIFISGAHVYFRRTRNSKWSYWTFTEFAKMLEDNKRPVPR